MLHIYGPDIEGLKGKKVRHKSDKIKEIARVNIPNTIKDLHPNINLLAYFFFVQGTAFLYSVSECYGFRTVENIKNFGKKYDKTKMSMGINF